MPDCGQKKTRRMGGCVEGISPGGAQSEDGCNGMWLHIELILQRTKEALARKNAEGKRLGRPKGSSGLSKLDQHEDEIRKLLSHRVAKAAIARMCGSSR